MASNPNATFLGFAQLNDEQLAELSAVERDLGAMIVALKPTVPFAKLTPAQESRLQQLEQRLGIIALACQE